MKSPRVLVLGDPMLDEYIFCDSDKPSPEDSEIKVYNYNTVNVSPGGALNVAANIASLLDTTCYFGGILTYFTKRWVENYRVYPIPFYSFCGKTQIIKQRLINKENKQVCRIDFGKQFNRQEIEDYTKIFDDNADKLSSYDCIIVSDYCKGTICDKIIQSLKNVSCFVLVDTKNPDLSIWKDIPNCLIKINSIEDKSAYNKENIKRIVTHGKYGSCYYSEKKESTNIKPGKQIDNPNVIGAGDVYLAGLAAHYVNNKKCDIVDMMHYADSCARASVKKLGTIIVSPGDVS